MVEFKDMGAHGSLNSKIVTLLSDFGTKDAYVGIMKGVILSIDPQIRIIDLTHEIEPHNILSGAYVLYTAWNAFPRGSVFCAVVDPGVGSRRGTLVAEIDERILIAPDNGLISLLIRMFPSGRAFALQQDAVGEKTASSTFHGRDLFAPAAALCCCEPAQRLQGPLIKPVALPAAFPRHSRDTVTGAIVHVDRFGNCISSIHSDDIARLQAGGRGRGSFRVGGFEELRMSRTYADVPVGAPLCLIGSSGFLEVAVREDSAAERFAITTGQTLSATAVDDSCA